MRPQLIKLGRAARFIATIALLSVAVILSVGAFRAYEYTPWTRDGRISAYVIDSASEVPGLVTAVAVQDNQFVHKDDLLYKIDSRDYEAAVKRTHADLDSARAQLEKAKADLEIEEEMARGKAASKLDVIVAHATVLSDEASVESGQAALYRAQIDLERCEIRSPVNGYVTNLTVRAGNFAAPGQRQMSVIDADSYWISGYFEETRLQKIRVGDTARAVLMGYPDDTLLGHVDSINRGIADTNTAPNPQGLPQVNPVFTWVRLAQRIPVRIHVDGVPQSVHLAVGETCTVYIDKPR
jgi:multidrug resistance efflux pump